VVRVVIELTLPYPISANRYWRSFVPRGHTRAIVTLSDEAKAFKNQVGWMCRAAGVREPIAGRVSIEILLYPKRPLDWERRMRKNPLAWDDDVQCLDLDNANKVLLDSLKGIAIDDDRWVRRIVSERMEPDGEARVVVRITPLALPVTPQAELLGEAA
jgi:crossover junction endodeoxyribonuclease RusA